VDQFESVLLSGAPTFQGSGTCDNAGARRFSSPGVPPHGYSQGVPTSPVVVMSMGALEIDCGRIITEMSPEMRS